jgi:hypothetical protein
MAFVIFDRASGQIVGVRHGAADIEAARRTGVERLRQAERARPYIETDVLEAPNEVFDGAGKFFKVDVERRVLMEVGEAEGGTGIGFGSVAGPPSDEPRPPPSKGA